MADTEGNTVHMHHLSQAFNRCGIYNRLVVLSASVELCKEVNASLHQVALEARHSSSDSLVRVASAVVVSAAWHTMGVDRCI